MELRPYQQEAVTAVYNHLRTRDDNPCVVLPTGTGKSLVIARIVQDAVNWKGRVLILAHVKELLEQNADKIRKLCPELKVGVYSAGLKSRDTGEQVIVAGIQSVYGKACDLGPFDLVMIDECHLLNSDSDDSMYQSFLKDMKVVNPRVRLIGLTATPFRLKGGPICCPENLLNHVCYEAGLKEMIRQGYLSPLISKAGRSKAELDGLHIRGGEFVADEVAEAMDREELVNTACGEIVSLTHDRKSVLIFAASVEHCRHVAEKIARFSGRECAVVTGDTLAAERAETIARFKGEFVPDDLFGTPKPPLKFLSNVNVLTTGFDSPNTDCVVLLRPTNSAGLLLQMCGRGTRLSPETGKTDCLILDYGGNIMRHGPIDMIEVAEKRESGGEAPAKTCPECQAIIHAAYQTCPECGYQFPPPEKGKHDAHASTAGILSGQSESATYEVSNTYYAVHSKRGAPDNYPKTMRIDYRVGFNDFRSEWVCPEHTGYAREKFIKWWRERAAPEVSVPDSAEDAVALANSGILAEPSRITVKMKAGETFLRIIGYCLKPKPDYVSSPGKNSGKDEWESESDFGNNDLPF